MKATDISLNRVFLRMPREQIELESRIDGTTDFVASSLYNKLSSKERHLLEEQMVHMRSHARVMSERIADFLSKTAMVVVNGRRTCCSAGRITATN